MMLVAGGIDDLSKVKEKKILLDWPEFEYVAGVDEVGRGCGAGPVVTAAVILPKGINSPLIRDSKKLSEKQRNEAYKLISEKALAITCHAGTVSDINTLGIDGTTFKTMHKCLDELSIKPQHILVDGNRWDVKDNNVTCIPKGDDTYACIAAAAIVAKVRRDEYMSKLHDLFPNYGWNTNKGYLTETHITGLKKFGTNRYHRTLFVKNFVN